MKLRGLTVSGEVDRPMFQRMQLNVAEFLEREVKKPLSVTACLPKNREYIVHVGAERESASAYATSVEFSREEPL
jgi:hypothetical protein